jgi:hypothetical protein
MGLEDPVFRESRVPKKVCCWMGISGTPRGVTCRESISKGSQNDMTGRCGENVSRRSRGSHEDSLEKGMSGKVFWKHRNGLNQEGLCQISSGKPQEGTILEDLSQNSLRTNKKYQL